MEHEISTEFDPESTCNEVLCTKCGMATEDLRNTRWVCNDIATRVDAVFKVSQWVRSWTDAMRKLARLYCLNNAETEAGFEPNDEILERTEDYALIRDARGLLLIVIHDQDTQNLIEKLRQPKAKSITAHIEVTF